jgi:BirA family biotin operon repressor/biotin-[acetyl-CoA-carboxylase] ligase
MTPADLARLTAETRIARVESLAEISSTNDRALELAKTRGAETPLLVLADRQTAGRGRGGNRWWTGEGSLAFSVLFDNPMQNDFSASPLIGLVAALAIVETVRSILPGCEIGLHWPNDVFITGRKIAGILVEVTPDRKTVIGIGLNVNNTTADAPEELQATATTLFDVTQQQQDRTSILISLLNQLERFLDLARSEPKKLATLADASCLQKDRLLHLQWGATIHTGRCLGLDGTGAILLETTNGPQAFPAGILIKE